MNNKLAASYESILIKLDDITFSQLGFSKLLPKKCLKGIAITVFLMYAVTACGRP